MCMRAGHQAGAAPCAVVAGWSAWEVAGWVAGAFTVTAVMVSCTTPDLDHPRFRGRVHPGAALVRTTARWAYRIRTDRDRERTDTHRGPSHSLEWCAVVGLLVAFLASRVPFLDPYVWWLALGAFVGTASHVVMDAMTPSGVPVSAVFNYFRYGEVWRRHAFGWQLLYPDRWWLRWVRYPIGMSVDDRDLGCRPGWFRTDSGAEHLIVVPVLWGTAALLVVVLSGAFGLVFSALTGVGMS